jgi:hypothetical protein
MRNILSTHPPTRAAIALRCAATLLAASLCSTAVAQAPMPQPQTEGGVTYLNGGAGDEEVQFIKQSIKDYSLALAFSRTGGEYVASVSITIKDAKGATVFEAPSVGPYLLVKLAPGKYSVVASYQGDAQTRPVTVGKSASSLITFGWK